MNTKVPESKVELVTPGLRATISVDSFPHSSLSGTVVSVAPLPDVHSMATWDPIVYTTKVRLDEALPALRPGMTAQVEIKIGELDNVLAVPNQAVIRFDGKNQVALQQPDGSFEWRVVVLGANNDAMSEVKSGLKSGDSVALKPEALLSDEQRRQISVSPTAPARPRGETPKTSRWPGDR